MFPIRMRWSFSGPPATLSIVLARLLNTPEPYWSVIATIVVM
jgi:hypothetical protein